MACDLNPMPLHLREGLEDLAGEVRYARRQDDLGHLASLCYCEVRRWARIAGEDRLADISRRLVTDLPANNRQMFLQHIDCLLAELEEVCQRADIHVSFQSPREGEGPRSPERQAGTWAR